MEDTQDERPERVQINNDLETLGQYSPEFCLLYEKECVDISGQYTAGVSPPGVALPARKSVSAREEAHAGGTGTGVATLMADRQQATRPRQSRRISTAK